MTSNNLSSVVSFITIDNSTEYYGMLDIQDYLRFANIPNKDEYTTRTGYINLGGGDTFTCKSLEEMTDKEIIILSKEVMAGTITDYDDTLIHYLSEHSQMLQAVYQCHNSNRLFTILKNHLEEGNAEAEHDDDMAVLDEYTLRDGTKVHTDPISPEWREV